MTKSISQPGFSALEATEAKLEKASNNIMVLLIDDQAIVAQAVKKMLENEKDIQLTYCDDPTKALQVAFQIKPTVILQDLVMPDVDGLTMVKFFRANPLTKNVPMIVLSSREEPDIKSQAFSLGANDYIVKLPDKLELIARIRYHSKAYINLIERNEAFDALVASQTALKAELKEAENYVRSLLPEKLDSELFKTDWVFTSSTDLGGDAFGYHWLDNDHFAIYLLDVCGHGVGAALLSVSAINVLRAQSLPEVDFFDPASVLTGMNETFNMEEQNQMYFTFWYGVYNKQTRELTYASGGHPPAILISNNKIIKLATPGMVIGGFRGISFTSNKVTIQPNDHLYIFSDGVYEVDYNNQNRMMSVDDFAQELLNPPANNKTKVQSMVEFSSNAQGSKYFSDDYSLVEIVFNSQTS